MTGPLAPLFAQVREGIGAVDADGTMQGLVGREVRRVEDAFAALSSIERHVQDMEKALDEARDWYRDHRSDGFYDEQMWGDPFVISPQLRAALPAREKEEE